MDSSRASEDNKIDTMETSQFVEVAADRLSLRYVGQGRREHDVGVVRSCAPLSPTKLIGYFEVTFSSALGIVSIGLCCVDAPWVADQHPGVETGCFAYHSNGQKYTRGSGADFATDFEEGDVIGAGIHHGRKEVFFTKNGTYLGVAFKKCMGAYYATVGLHASGDVANFNFGHSPFLFDIQSMETDELESRANDIRAIPLPASDPICIVRQYLLHYGYGDTLRIFDKEQSVGDVTKTSSADEASLDLRKRVRELVLQGKPLEARALVEKEGRAGCLNAPEGRSARAHIDTLHFILTIEKGDSETAIDFAQKAFVDIQDLEIVQNAMALLAYEDTSSPVCPVRHLLSSAHRETVADQVNDLLLRVLAPDEVRHLGKNKAMSHLEHLLRALEVARELAREDGGGPGDVFSVREFVRPKA